MIKANKPVVWIIQQTPRLGWGAVLAAWLSLPLLLVGGNSGWLGGWLGLVGLLVSVSQLGVRANVRQQNKLIQRQQSTIATIQHREADREASGHNLKSELGSTINDLSATVAQQAMGAARQVTAVVQLGSLMTELSQAAGQITERSQMLEQAAQNVLNSTRQVAATTQQVANARDRGHQAVASTIEENQRVLEVYNQLSHNFSTLEASSTYIRSLLSLIENFSHEIHLLSLNAAIEAAGAGEYGDRFAVVAQEVKSLADKTHLAVNNVREGIAGVDSALLNARAVIVTGSNSVRYALNVAEESGAVIEQFEGMVEQAVREADSIARLAGEMETQATEIAFAIRLQQSSSQHALQELSTVQRVAQSSAIAGQQISSSVSRLKNLSGPSLPGV